MSQNTPAQVELVVSQTAADGRPQFVIPSDAGGLAKVDVVDLDFIVTTESGRQFLLPQAALWSATQIDPVVVVQGQGVAGSELARQVGPVQPPELGGTRLTTMAKEEDDPERIAGNEFGLGQESWDLAAASLEQGGQLMSELLQAVQEAQTQQFEQVTAEGNQGPGRTFRTHNEPSPLASPTPGAPPKPNNIEEQAGPNPEPQPGGGGSENAIVSFKLLAANVQDVTFQGADLRDSEVRQIFRESEVALKMQPNAANLIFEAGKVDNQLLLESVPTTNSLTLTVGAGEKVPNGLTINGQALTAGSSITVSTVGMADNQLRLNMQWDEGAGARDSNFQLSVFSQADDQRPLQVISFIGDTAGAYTLDLNSQPRLFVASKANNLVVEGNALANTITTGNGNDSIMGSDGADTINGGGGKDTVDYSASTVPVTVNLVTGIRTGGQANGDQLSNIEILKGSTTNSDTLDFRGATTPVNVNFITGTTNQKLNGSDENLTFSGFENAVGSANDDVFVANDAANNFKGGEGSDTVSYAGSTAVVVNLHEGKGFNVNVNGNASGDTYESIENIIGSSFNDTFIASDAINTFTGGGGVDRVSYVHSTSGVTVNLSNGQGSGGFAADDKYIGIVNATGSNHNDTFVGNNQGNNFQGGDGIDTVSYVNSASGVTVNLKDQWGSGGDASSDSYSSIENAIGSAHNDTFIASIDKNYFDGLGGNNTLSYQGSADGVTVNLSTGAASGVHAAGDTFANIQNLTGGSGNDVLTGDVNNNVLMGGAGADQFFGGGGIDTVSYQDAPINTSSSASTNGVVIDLNNTIVGEGRGEGFAKGDVIAGDVAVVLGSNHNDIFYSNRDGVKLDGGNGTDTIDFRLATAGVTVDLGVTSKFVSIERVVGSNFNDTLTAASNNGSTAFTNNNHILTANNSKSILVAGNGNDTVTGGNGADFIDMVTNNTSLVGDSVKAGTGNDTVWINAAHVDGTVKNLDGGTGFDTLRVIAGATLDLGALNAQNFERVDLRTDGGSTQVSLSSADIRALVNSGTGNNVLTLRLDRNDTYTIETEANVRVTQGQSVSFFNTANNNLIAQVNFEYA